MSQDKNFIYINNKTGRMEDVPSSETTTYVRMDRVSKDQLSDKYQTILKLAEEYKLRAATATNENDYLKALAANHQWRKVLREEEFLDPLYSGLLDKNGRRIFKDDIISWEVKGVKHTHVVEYHYGAFGFFYDGMFHSLWSVGLFVAFSPFSNKTKFEIVGNANVKEGGDE